MIWGLLNLKGKKNLSHNF